MSFMSRLLRDMHLSWVLDRTVSTTVIPSLLIPLSVLLSEFTWANVYGIALLQFYI